jgi:hypothetical protein
MVSRSPQRTDLVLVVTLLLVLPVLFPSRAHAYLDPGTGSFFLQAAIAVLLAGVVTLKHSWHRVRNLFHRSKRDETDPDLDD